MGIGTQLFFTRRVGDIFNSFLVLETTCNSINDLADLRILFYLEKPNQDAQARVEFHLILSNSALSKL